MIRRISFGILTAATVIALAGALVVAAWYVDDQVAAADTVPRNVSIGRFDVGGLTASQLDAALRTLQTEVGAQPVTIEVPPRSFETTNDALGVSLDIDKLRDQALNLGREGDWLDRFRTWIDSLGGQRTIGPVYSYDSNMAIAWFDDHPDRVLTSAEEPSFTGADGSFVVTPRVVGEQLDAIAIATSLDDAVAAGPPPYAIASSWVPLEPEVSADMLQTALDAAAGLADTPITLRVGDETIRLGRETIRRWIDSEQDGSNLYPVLSTERADTTLALTLSGIETEGVDPTFAVNDEGELEIEPGIPAERCCGPGVGELVVAAVDAGPGSFVELPTVPAMTPEEQIEEFGIVELVAEFTTNHACCQGRVTNIQNMADIVRGAMLAPGEQFSLNGYVGERTRAKGFVPAGTILSGRIVDTVGGGVSQFATTTFNAAFFAGMEFIEYQSHSLYISRYPYGREATVNWPNVNLIFENVTPYNAMIWTSYTGTSITVQIWSTPHFVVEQTGQSTGSAGRVCTRVNTFRSRTAPDGEVLEDSVFATYRPREGLDCNGNETPEPNV